MPGIADKLIIAVVALIAIIAIAWIIIKYGATFLTGLLPNKDAPKAGQTGTTPDGKTIVGPDVKYVNPALCVLTGQFCDPNTDDNETSTPTKTQPVIDLPPNYATAPTAEKLVAKLNRGESFTQDELSWAQRFEPALWVMMRGSS